jgi:thiol-disulfide isomerase/thioredoxin
VETGPPDGSAPSPPPDAPKSYPPGLAQGEPSQKPPQPARIPPKVPPPPPPPSLPPTLPDPNTPKAPPVSAGPKTLTPVASAVVLGNQVINFALPDAYGAPWEWKANRKGKVALLDFWRTSCVPCLHAIPELCILQERYGWSGLEVIGIASEPSGSFEQQKDSVARVANLKRTNYRLLLNSGPNQRDLLDKFDVRAFPTLVLVDERGHILWRHEGGLSRSDLDALEQQIKRRLGVR